MSEKIPTLLFHATGEAHWRRILIVTGLHLLRGFPGGEKVRSWPYVRGRRSLHEEFRVLSYMTDWRDAFCQDCSLDVTLCDINNLVEYAAGLRKLGDYPLAVVLHSAAWDAMKLLRMGMRQFRRRRGKLLVLFGDEYFHLPQKIAFAQGAEVDYIGTQLPLSAARWLYADATKSKVLPAPHALNPKVFTPRPDRRSIDVGFRGAEYVSAFLGDDNRNKVVERVLSRAQQLGLTTDGQYRRYPREEWATFLNSCRAVVGAEAGTAYLEKDDRTRRAVAQFLQQSPGATFSEVYERFYKPYPNPVSGKAISSRHFEPIGTKTCQFLLEGHYNGILKGGEHYIEIKKDYSNLDEALRQFTDVEYRNGIVESAYQYVMADHTYAHRVRELLRAVGV